MSLTKKGMRIVIDLRRGETPEVIVNNLFSQTQLQSSFGINMVALVDGAAEDLEPQRYAGLLYSSPP